MLRIQSGRLCAAVSFVFICSLLSCKSFRPGSVTCRFIKTGLWSDAKNWEGGCAPGQNVLATDSVILIANQVCAEGTAGGQSGYLQCWDADDEWGNRQASDRSRGYRTGRASFLILATTITSGSAISAMVYSMVVLITCVASCRVS